MVVFVRKKPKKGPRKQEEEAKAEYFSLSKISKIIRDTINFYLKYLIKLCLFQESFSTEQTGGLRVKKTSSFT
jgi:hypothetical protein